MCISVVVSGREVDAAETVDLQINEAGSRNPTTCWRGKAVSDNAPVYELDVAGYQLAANQRRFDAESHQ